MKEEEVKWKVWSEYQSVSAKCKDQFENEKLVEAAYFQRLPSCVNKICLTSGYGNIFNSIDEDAEMTINAFMDIAEAIPRAKKWVLRVILSILWM